MLTSSNKAPSQNQLATDGITHKLIYMLKPFNFINVGQTPLSYSKTPPFLETTSTQVLQISIFKQNKQKTSKASNLKKKKEETKLSKKKHPS